jgi:hypothetical protein
MPRLAPEPPPPAERLGPLPLHVLVRDYPETLAVLRRHGVDIPAAGGGSVADAVTGRAELKADLLAALAWRAQP